MPKHSQPRSGSLQFWPRKRAAKIIPSVNWKPLSSKKSSLLGFIVYKVGMLSCVVKDNTEHSLTKGQKIVVPCTILEAPSLKIFSIRFYKDNRIMKEVFIGGEKELKKKIRLPKKQKEGKHDLQFEDYDHVRILVYSLVSRTNIKKKPDVIELGISGSKEEQLAFVKDHLNKEISIAEVFQEGLVDARGVTKGKGFQGPVKRFGISLRFHKSEKGVRKVGSIGPWHPARVTFRVPMAGQMGFFSRISYNNKILSMGKISEKNINPKGGFKHYGDIKTDYIILQGSVAGPRKRQLVLTSPLRPNKKQTKKNYEYMGLR